MPVKFPDPIEAPPVGPTPTPIERAPIGPTPPPIIGPTPRPIPIEPSPSPIPPPIIGPTPGTGGDPTPEPVITPAPSSPVYASPSPFQGVAEIETSERTNDTLATNRRIPLLYGTTRVDGRIFAIDYDAGTWTVGVAWCVGPVASISALHLNDKDPVAGVQQEHHTGTNSQRASPLLTAAINNYADNLIAYIGTKRLAVAYSVIQYTDPGHYETLPKISALVSSGSDSPLDAIRTLIESPIVGLGERVDAASFEAAKAYDNELVNGTQTRRKLGMLVDEDKTVRAWITALSAYAGAYIYRRVNTWYAVADKPAVPTLSLTSDAYQSLAYRSPQWSSLPTVISVTYTYTDDEGVSSEQTATVLDDFEHEVELRQNIKMPGIPEYGQAYREGKERLGAFHELQYQISGGHHLIRYEPGDTLELTQKYMIENETIERVIPIRIDEVEVSEERVDITAREYTLGRHSDETPSTPDISHGSVIIGEN